MGLNLTDNREHNDNPGRNWHTIVTITIALTPALTSIPILRGSVVVLDDRKAGGAQGRPGV